MDPRIERLAMTRTVADGKRYERIVFPDDEIRLRVNASSRGMVILSEIWDPGWTATVDGQGAQIYRADFMFRGVVVDTGEHEIVLRYPATKVKQTLLFYLIPLLAFGLLGIIATRDRFAGSRRVRSSRPDAEQAEDVRLPD